MSKINVMSKKDVIMPKMGESVAEATIISWNKNIGEKIEIAGEKLDSMSQGIQGVVQKIPIIGDISSRFLAIFFQLEILAKKTDN